MWWAVYIIVTSFWLNKEGLRSADVMVIENAWANDRAHHLKIISFIFSHISSSEFVYKKAIKYTCMQTDTYVQAHNVKW